MGPLWRGFASGGGAAKGGGWEGGGLDVSDCGSQGSDRFVSNQQGMNRRAHHSCSRREGLLILGALGGGESEGVVRKSRQLKKGGLDVVRTDNTAGESFGGETR